MGYGGTDKYYNPDNKVVHDGETANASDLNNINYATDSAFEQVADNLDAINTNANDKAELAEKWASNDQGDKPEASKDKYSSEANALESQDWANRASGQAIRLADGTTSSEKSALVNAAEAAADAALAAASETAASASATAAETAQTAAELAKTNAETAQTAAELAETNAETAETNAGVSETNALASESKASKWADEDEDVPVETDPDRFSAYHWMKQAEEIVGGGFPHSIAFHNDTSATGAQLDALVGAGDTSLHKHDNMYYTESESDALYSVLAHVHDDRYYTETEADALFAPISHSHGDLYYTETESDALFAPISHNHDSRYYTETESDSLFAALVHLHEDNYEGKDNLLINPEFLANTREYANASVIPTDSYFFDMWKSVGSSAVVTSTPGNNIILTGSISQQNDKLVDLDSFNDMTVSAIVTSGELEVTFSGKATVTLTSSVVSATVPAGGTGFGGLVTFNHKISAGSSVTFKELKIEDGSKSTPFKFTDEREEFLKGAAYLVDQDYVEESHSIVAVSSDILNLGGIVKHRNDIINGDFIEWRRSDWSTTSGYKTCDRFYNEDLSGGSITTTRTPFTVGQTDVPGDPRYFCLATPSGQTLTTDGAATSQRVADVNRYSGKTVCLTFWAKCATGTVDLATECRQNFGASYGSSLGVEKHSLTTTWQKFVTFIDISSVAGQTITSDSFTEFYFWYSAGSYFNSRTDTLGLSTVPISLAHISLTTSNIDVPVQFDDRETNLKRCEPYLVYMRKIYVCTGRAATIQYQSIAYPCTMRKIPTSLVFGNVIDVDSLGYTIASFAYNDNNLLSYTLTGISTTTLQRFVIEDIYIDAEL